jgi:hypothetical protein
MDSMLQQQLQSAWYASAQCSDKEELKDESDVEKSEKEEKLEEDETMEEEGEALLEPISDAEGKDWQSPISDAEEEDWQSQSSHAYAQPTPKPSTKRKYAREVSSREQALLKAEEEVSKAHCTPWQSRGPPGPWSQFCDEADGSQWRGQRYRAGEQRKGDKKGVGRWGNRGGGNREYYREIHSLKGKGGYTLEGATIIVNARYAVRKGKGGY